jgi:hypothetical protein
MSHQGGSHSADQVAQIPAGDDSWCAGTHSHSVRGIFNSHNCVSHSAVCQRTFWSTSPLKTSRYGSNLLQHHGMMTPDIYTHHLTASILAQPPKGPQAVAHLVAAADGMGWHSNVLSTLEQEQHHQTCLQWQVERCLGGDLRKRSPSKAPVVHITPFLLAALK